MTPNQTPAVVVTNVSGTPAFERRWKVVTDSLREQWAFPIDLLLHEQSHLYPLNSYVPGQVSQPLPTISSKGILSVTILHDGRWCFEGAVASATR